LLVALYTKTLFLYELTGIIVPMRILYVLNSGNPGGMEQHTLDLVRGMKGLGNQVFVWCSEGPIVSWFKEAGAEVTTVVPNIEIDPIYIFKLAKFLKNQQIDVVHAHELKPGVNTLIAAFVARTPVRITHTHTPISTWQVNSIAKWINTLVDSIAINLLGTKEIALTESRKKIKMEERIKEEKLVVIPNALNTDKFDIALSQRVKFREEILGRFKIPSDAFVFGNVSRLTEEKGHKILVEAFKCFLEFQAVDKEKTYLILAGGGRLEDQIKEQIKSLGLENKVFITGMFQAEDLVKFYSSFNSFIFPSLTEGFGIVLIEAMYFEVPVICSNLEVLQEVGGSTVRYFETGNSSDLAEKMLNLYQKRDRLGDLTTSARQRVEELYTLEKFVNSYEKLYLNLSEESL
jgi:glycosyltransferase involved in cell wall biosynthesis